MLERAARGGEVDPAFIAPAGLLKRVNDSTGERVSAADPVEHGEGARRSFGFDFVRAVKHGSESGMRRVRLGTACQRRASEREPVAEFRFRRLQKIRGHARVGDENVTCSISS